MAFAVEAGGVGLGALGLGIRWLCVAQYLSQMRGGPKSYARTPHASKQGSLNITLRVGHLFLRCVSRIKKGRCVLQKFCC